MSFTPNAAGFYSIAIDVLVFSDEELFERLVHAVIAVSEKQLGSVALAPLDMVGDSAHLVLNANAPSTCLVKRVGGLRLVPGGYPRSVGVAYLCSSLAPTYITRGELGMGHLQVNDIICSRRCVSGCFAMCSG